RPPDQSRTPGLLLCRLPRLEAPQFGQQKSILYSQRGRMTHPAGAERISMSGEIIDLSARQMTKAARESGHVRHHMPMAIEQIVDAYVRLKDGRALLDLRAHRQRLIVDLNKLRSNSNCNV